MLFGPAAVWGLVAIGGLVTTFADADAWGPVDRGAASPVGSDTCLRCHPQQHASWHRSYHRTMTQDATVAELLAPFAGETVRDLGFEATMTRTVDGVPHVTMRRDSTSAPPDVILDTDVELSVGSHRYQQYVGRAPDGTRVRLPFAWHVGADRWIPMRAAFLTPDGVPGEADDALRHVTPYDDNCIFCHNTEPAPGRRPDGTFEPKIAELGIACEACHGKASAHVRRQASPFRRVLAGLSGLRDGPEGSVLHPARLSAARHADVCGRCHGQRIGRDIADILVHGDGFVPGTDLATVSRPILRDSVVGDGPTGQFEARFWPDGTPRLSAYEYQALQLSPCFDEGRGLSCGDCHTMHGDDPDMQLRADYDEAAVCAGCHRGGTLSGADAPGGHGGHGEVRTSGGAAVGCADCHRPRITYGLVTGMASHRITVPDPAAAVGRDDTPDACTQCHVDRSSAWAAGEPEASAPARVARDLLGGDPIQRALATDALARDAATLPARTRAAWLVDALEDDYPAIRFMAWRALTRVLAEAPELAAELAAFDPTGDVEVRIERAAALRARLGPGALADDPRREAIVAGRDDHEIWIGE
jgi:predicted CXXCH cytochrome family protein